MDWRHLILLKPSLVSTQQEIDGVRQTQPERKTEVRNVVTHGMGAIALADRVFPSVCSRERLADGLFAVLGEDSVG